MNNQFSLWLINNSFLLAEIFGAKNILLDDINWQSIVIKNFELPPYWRQLYSRLKIVFPTRGRGLVIPPDKFYLDLGLRTVRGKIPEHYFERDYFNDLYSKGWARYSFHIKNGWKPSMIVREGTNLVNVLDMLHDAMFKAARDTK
ncbi:MAG: hypothetical protein DRP46_08410 [Candidatus Zixiibacteriota bacterium]|nr:MAG: hypothetical protein DRP46_08410 [candidate division Zixibacteria bacterium]